MDIVTDLYEIKITSNKNNLNLNDTCTITVQAIDFNGNNVNGKNIKLEVNKGNFVNGNTNLGQSYTGTTGANGFTINYKANENGIITFKSQNSNLQIQCNGWKRYTMAVTNGRDCYLYINENQRKAFLSYTCTLTSYTGAGSAQTVENLDIPTQYKPSLSSVRAVGSRLTVAWALTTNGAITYRVQTNKTDSNNGTVRFKWTY